MMKKISMTVCAVVLAMVGISAFAQQSYPDSIFAYQLENRVTYKGNAPKISDILTAYLNVEETDEVLGSMSDAWNHYLRQEPQEPCTQFMIDEKNGYLRYTFDTRLCDDFDDLDSQTFVEMCYWNCSDGKHKLIAENCVSMMDSKYMIGQYSGISFFLYDNASHKMWTVAEEDLGAYVEGLIDESNCETGEEMTSDGQTVVVYNLPQQGKDITVEIYRGNKRTVTRLVWDGMYFKRQ